MEPDVLGMSDEDFLKLNGPVETKKEEDPPVVIPVKETASEVVDEPVPEVKVPAEAVSLTGITTGGSCSSS